MEREKMKVFVMMCNRMNSESDDLACDWAFIGDVYDDWTNEKMPSVPGPVTNFWTNLQKTEIKGLKCKMTKRIKM
jgi:hypothetical protein